MPTVVITGATGFVGSYLVGYFQEFGWEVRGLARNPSSRGNKNVRFYKYALGDEPPEQAFAGADYLIHTAYSPHTTKQADAFEHNVNAARQLLAVSRQHKLKKNIFISSMSASDNALSTYGQQKYAIEQLFNTKLDISVRAGLVIGSGGLVEQMLSFIKKVHVVPLIGGGKQPLQIIAISDLARAFQTILASGTVGVLTLANPEIYSYQTVYRAFARHAHTKTLFMPVPYWILSASITISHTLHLPFAITKDNLLGLKQNHAVDTTADLASIDLQPLSLDEALQKLA